MRTPHDVAFIDVIDMDNELNGRAIQSSRANASDGRNASESAEASATR